jgi:uncharacterized coiled-coil protein SlyX
MLMNIRSHRIYSRKFRLSVLDLTRIDLATNEDRKYHIDYWASLFKATTWEEIKMLAQKDTAIEEASNTVYKLSQEEKIRLQCEAREEYYRVQRTRDKLWENAINDKKELEAALAEKEAVLAEKDSTIAEQNTALAEKDATITGMKAYITDLENQLKKQ